MNKRELIYEGKVVDLYKDTVTLPNGIRLNWIS